MARLSPVKQWKATFDIKVENLAIAPMIKKPNPRSKTCSVYLPHVRGNDILFNVGDRVRSAFIDRYAALSGLSRDSIKAGVWVESLPEPGEQPIAKISDVVGIGTERQVDIDNKEMVLVGLKEYPVAYTIPAAASSTGKLSSSNRIGYVYFVKRPVKMSFSMDVLLRDMHPEAAQELFLKGHTCVGDRHSRGYGRIVDCKMQVLQEPTALKFFG